MEDPDFAKQNNCDSAARPLTDIPTKLLKQGFDVPPRQAAAYGSGEDQLKGALALPPRMVLRLGTRRGLYWAACWARITLKVSGGKKRSAFISHHGPRPLNLDVGPPLSSS